MKSNLSRRSLVKGIASSVLAPALLPISAAQAAEKPYWMGNGMPQEGSDTPKIGTSINYGWVRPPGEAAFGTDRVNPASRAGGTGVPTEEAIRGAVQIGVYHVLGGGPTTLPWTVEELQPAWDKLKAAGVTMGNLMINVPPSVIYSRNGRDADIEKIKQSLQAAGKVGVPVVEYNFYAHRAMEAYYEESGRGGAGITGVDYERMKGLSPLPEEGMHDLNEMWENLTYFLKAVVPTAEKANVRMALHPNDPPVPLSRGSQQIMATVAGWKHLIEIVDSPSNGITFDCGVTREMGEDPVTVCRYFGHKDRINHMHFRGPHVHIPYVRYDEGFLDEGDVNLFAVMRELVKQRYPREFFPEHPRALDYDRTHGPIGGYPGGGGYAGNVYDIAYGKAMLQAALIVERG